MKIIIIYYIYYYYKFKYMTYYKINIKKKNMIRFFYSICFINLDVDIFPYQLHINMLILYQFY